MLPLFQSHGKGVKFFPTNSTFSYKNIILGNDVFIGPRAYFSSIVKIKIGNKVMFGPNVTIMGGDHRLDVIGKYMYDIKEKRTEDDLPVIIESDVWIGANVTILKGVTIGRGAIVTAGALFTKSLPSYTICVGVPAKPIKLRWNLDKIAEHEKILYPPKLRLNIDNLKSQHKEFQLI